MWRASKSSQVSARRSINLISRRWKPSRRVRTRTLTRSCSSRQASGRTVSAKSTSGAGVGECAISYRRGGVPPRVVVLWPSPAIAPRLFDRCAHRLAACAIRDQHRGRDRYPDQDRIQQPRLVVVDVWRQLELATTQLFRKVAIADPWTGLSPVITSRSSRNR